jgi:hypothetical protein
VAGVAISVAAVPFSSPVRLTTGRTLLTVALLGLHLAGCVGYYLYVQDASADTALYYFHTRFADTDFAVGTVFVAKLTQYLRFQLGGSYFECFVFFQSLGFWGVILLMRTFQEIHLKLGVSETLLPTYLLFLPSIHFWTSAIGKDAPLFLAVSLCVWSALNWRKRLIPFALALIIMVLFRAHIALIAVLSVAVAAFLQPGFSIGRKAALMGMTVVGGLLLAESVEQTISIDVTSASSFASFADRQSHIAESVGGTTSIGNVPLVIRFFSLLFRPLFFDAGGAAGMVSSMENVGSILLFVYLAKNWRSIRALAKQVFFLQFCITFAAILIVLLSYVYYNVGLGLRERVMVFPPLFCVFVASWAMPWVPFRVRPGLSPVHAGSTIARSRG